MRQLEVDRDLRLNLHRLAVQKIRLVLPLLDGVAGCFGQLSVAADDLDMGDIAVLGNRRHQLDYPLDVHPKRILRVRRSYFLKQEALRNAL